MPKAPSVDSFRYLKSINILADNKLHFLNEQLFEIMEKKPVKCLCIILLFHIHFKAL